MSDLKPSRFVFEFCDFCSLRRSRSRLFTPVFTPYFSPPPCPTPAPVFQRERREQEARAQREAEDVVRRRQREDEQRRQAAELAARREAERIEATRFRASYPAFSAAFANRLVVSPKH